MNIPTYSVENHEPEHPQRNIKRTEDFTRKQTKEKKKKQKKENGNVRKRLPGKVFPREKESGETE